MKQILKEKDTHKKKDKITSDMWKHNLIEEFFSSSSPGALFEFVYEI